MVARSRYRSNAPEIIGTPAVINNHITQYVAGNTFNYTPGFTPTVGNLLVIFYGGTASGAGTSVGATITGGFTKITGDAMGAGGVPVAVFVKEVTASESTPYVISMNDGRTADNILVRGLEISGANTDKPIELVQDTSTGNVTSFTGAAFDAGYKGMLITFASHGGSIQWNNTWGSGGANDGFLGTTVRTHVGWRTVSTVNLGETVTWYQSGSAATLRFTTVLIRSKTKYN